MPLTIAEVLARHAARDAGAPAIVSAGLGTLSFGGLVRHVRQIGNELAAAGIGPSSRVGIALQRGPEAALLNVAISANATVLPINPHLPPAELREELKRIRLHALVVSGEAGLPPWVDEDEEGVVLFKASKAASSFEEIALAPVKDVRRPAPPSRVTEQSWAAIFRTSGTTGPSKRVPVTHENLVEMARKMERWLALTPADRSACIMPI
jgi:acyl-CoA synthetase (AMP-forming)/AMP-acid ligase II